MSDCEHRAHQQLLVVPGEHDCNRPQPFRHEFLQGPGLVAALNVREVRLQTQGLEDMCPLSVKLLVTCSITNRPFQTCNFRCQIDTICG